MFLAKQLDVVSDRGFIVGGGWPMVTINGIAAAKPGDAVAPHACCGAPGCDIHCVAVMTAKLKPQITINGMPVVVMGDQATCMEPVNRQTIPSAVFVG
jgi:uncharacterized Zn-binding protein involved in type VI secretion